MTLYDVLFCSWQAAAAAAPVLPLPNTRTLVVADTSALLGQI